MLNPPTTTKKLGQLLVERGCITGEQLIRAIQSQRVVGGRIGTCLLEMDVLTEDKLLEALSQQLSVPAAHVDELRTISEHVLKLIPSKVASKWQAVPFFVDETDVRVATLNVKNLACLDEIEFCTNRRVRPHIANEVRIFEALEKYYRIECPRRYGHLLDRLNRSRYMWDESAKVLIGASEAEWNGGRHDMASADAGSADAGRAGNGARRDKVMRPPASRSTRSLGETPPSPSSAAARPAKDPLSPITWPATLESGAVEDSPVATRGGSPAVPETLTLMDVENLLAGQADQKSIGQILLRFLGQSFSRCAIFAIRNGAVRGWLHRGESFDGPLFHSLEIRLDRPSAFLGLAKGADFFFGPLAAMPSHRMLARCWGGELPEQCLMLPVRLRGRLISVIYGDCGPSGLQGIDLELLKELAEKAAIAFELCILRRKLHQRIATPGNGGAG